MIGIKGIVSGTGSGLTAPKYYQIKMHIVNRIESGEYKAESKLPSENELSRMFEVNQNTAKKALRELELEKYIYRVQGKGSYVAPIEAKKTLTGTIALLVSNVEDIFYSNIVKYINNEAINKDCHLMFCNTQQSFEILKKNVTELLNNKKIDGFIANPAELSNNPEEYQFYKFLKDKGVHFVLLFPQKEIDFANTVRTDSESGAYLSVKYLLDQGYSEVVFITHSDLNDLGIRQRLQGCRRAFREAGLKFKDKYIFKVKNVSISQGYLFGEKLLKNRNAYPKAFYAVSDILSIGLQRRFGEAGIKIPEDIALVPSGCLDMTDEPGLRTIGVTFDFEQLCRKSFELLQKDINGGLKKPEHLIFPHKLIME